VAKKIGDVKKDISFLERVIEQASQKYPENIELNSKIGQIYEEQKQKDKAIECFERALKNKKFADLLSYLGVVRDLDNRYELKEKQGSKKEEEKYESFSGDAETSFKHLLNLYFEKGEYNKVIDWCTWLAIQKIPDVEKYVAPMYVKVGEALVAKYKPHLEEEKKVEEAKTVPLTLKDFAMPAELKKQIDFVLFKIKKDKCPDSILLYGPPGCGKTELARCIAGELGVECYEIDSDVLSKWVGESEKNVRETFEKLWENKKGVLFIDEFESFGLDRRQHEHSWEHTLSSEMLRQIEKTLKCENTQILIIAATNLREVLDKAMIRAGRFNHHIYLGKPDLNVREEIFKIKLNNLKTKGKKISSKLDYNKFANETEGLTGADIHHIVHDNIDQVLYDKGEEEAGITNDIVLEAIKKQKKQGKGEGPTQPYYV